MFYRLTRFDWEQESDLLAVRTRPQMKMAVSVFCTKAETTQRGSATTAHEFANLHLEGPLKHFETAVARGFDDMNRVPVSKCEVSEEVLATISCGEHRIGFKKCITSERKKGRIV